MSALGPLLGPGCDRSVSGCRACDEDHSALNALLLYCECTVSPAVRFMSHFQDLGPLNWRPSLLYRHAPCAAYGGLRGCALHERAGKSLPSITHHGCIRVWSPLVARAMVSRGYIRDVSRLLSSRRSDDTNRRAF
jgi:hypothetical protein